MTDLDLSYWRLHNQHISHRPFEKPGDVVRWLGAVQAQDYLYALWALGLRLSGTTEADIEQAIADRTIVRTWPMRGTVHFVPPEDAAWMTELLAPRVIRSAQSVYRKAELDEAVLAKSKNVLAGVLQGKQLTRKEVYAALEQAGIAATGSTPVGLRGMHIVKQLAMEGFLCFGPRRGKQATFVLLDEWAPNPRKLERDEALAELPTRYFTSHGPATAYDFAWWTGLTVSDARQGIDLAKPHLEREIINGTTYWFAGSMPAAETPSQEAYLLPYLDEYSVGYQDRSTYFDPCHEAQVKASARYGLLDPVIVVGGRIVGLWKRSFEQGKVVVDTTLFAPLSEAQEAAVAVAAQRLGRFVGRPVECSIEA